MDQVLSRLPPLDPSGVPFSNILRGEIAELGSLRSALDPHLRELLQVESQKIVRANYRVDDRCDDGPEEGGVQASVNVAVEAAESEPGGVMIDREGSDTNNDLSESKKRDRDDDGEDELDEVDEEDAAHEDLLYYHPDIRMSCSMWPSAEGTNGDLFITTVRVLFVSSRDESDDVAIDARYIALHAVDSLPGEDGTVSHHVYCQLSDGDDVGVDAVTTSGVGMLVPDECDHDCGADDENSQKEEGTEGWAGEVGALELYLRPADTCRPGGQSVICQDMFEALTQLASLNPVEDDDDGYGGGLFEMMAMMGGGGVEGEMIMAQNGADHESDDDMVVRLGDGNNNVIEEEVDDNERQAMLDRLDNLLHVPPEFEINSDDDGGQFDDADDDDDEDIL